MKSEKEYEYIKEIEQLKEEKDKLAQAYLRQEQRMTELSRQVYDMGGYDNKLPKASIMDHCLSVCFDLWPLSDWKRLSWSRTKNSYTQLVVGPTRWDWFVG